MKTLVLSVFTAMVLVSIYSCECYNTCGKRDYNSDFVAVGFSDTELTPLILKTYVAGTNFAQVADSFTFTEFRDAGFAEEGLAVNHIFFDNQNGFDYTISLPTVGRNYQVSGLNFEKEECKKCGKKTIINTLKGYTVNGVVNSTDGTVEIRE